MTEFCIANDCDGHLLYRNDEGEYQKLSFEKKSEAATLVTLLERYEPRYHWRVEECPSE